MADDKFMCAIKFLLTSGQSEQVEEWKTALREITTEARPLTRVKRCSNDGKTRTYEGWRNDEIAKTLDACCATDGPLWLQKVERLDSRGNLILGYGVKNGHHMAWRQRNQEAAKANSRLQAAKFRERARVEWVAYCEAYREMFPGSSPVGFDRWCRIGRTAWLAKGRESIQLNLVKGLAMDLAESAQEYLAKKTKRNERQAKEAAACSA